MSYLRQGHRPRSGVLPSNTPRTRHSIGARAVGAYAALALLLGGCTTTTLQDVVDDSGQKFSPSSRFVGFGFGDTAAQRVTPNGNYGTVSGSATKPGRVFTGTAPDRVSLNEAGSSETVGAVSPIAPSSDGRSYQLNFENTDVAAVSKAILGDILSVNYMIDPRVTGQINMTSSQPVPRGSLIALLETSLLSVNATLTKDGAVYRISPVGDPRGLVNVGFQAVADGYGTTVIPARYVPAANLAKVLDGLGGRSGTVKVEPSANLLMIQGTAAERRALLGAAAMVDVDWMRTKSVAILPVEHAAPETIIAEINRILGTGEGGLSQNVVQLQPISRLNAVLAVSSRRDAIDHVTRWVMRLDEADHNAAGVKVYRLKYAQAKTVAAMLNRMFGGRQNSAAGQADADQLEPGSDGPESSGSDKVASGQSAQSAAAATPTTASGGGTVNSSNLVKTSFADSSAQKTPAVDDSGGSDTRPGKPGAGRVRVTPDVTNNALFIETSPQTYAVVERAIREMDRFPTQVSIEVTIAEITLTSELQYGVQFFLKNGHFSAGLGGATGVPLRTTYPGLNLVSGALQDPQIVLDALAKFTSVKVLSSPSLVVVDRQPAVLQVGDQIPILTRQLTSAEGTTTANSVDMKDTGIILNVLPRVNANGIVTLNVEQQISNVTSTQPDTLTPTLSQRRVKSVISVSSGQTVLLAGLITDGQNINRNGLPVVSEIKLLNDLLSSHDRKSTRTELIIFIKPKIIASGQDAQRVTEEFLGRMRSIETGRGGVVRSKY